MTSIRDRIGRFSLRARLVMAVLAWTGLGTAAIWLAATRIYANHVEAHFNAELAVHIEELSRLTRLRADGQPELVRPLSDPRYEVPKSGYYWQISVDGRPPLGSASLVGSQLDPAIAHSQSVQHVDAAGPTGPAITYGLVRREADGTELHFVIATDHSELDALVERFTRDLTVWFALLGAGLLAAGVAMAGITLRPLAGLRLALVRFRRGETNALEGEFPAEVKPLVEELNAFIRNNAEKVAAARVEAGNLAHSLRTPLAVITDEAERSARDGFRDGAAQLLLDQARTMQVQIDYHLARVRARGGAGLPGATTALSSLVETVIQAFQRLYPDRDFLFDCRLAGDPVVQGDRVDLLEVLSVLLDNAAKWASRHVEVTLEQAGDRLLLAIADDGPGMAEADLEAAFGIGVRFDPAKPGSGLGLAIARSICADLGAELELALRTPPATGLVARLMIRPVPPG
ncbi:MAG: sensor histidine kinase [Novosphingobium sp.]